MRSVVDTRELVIGKLSAIRWQQSARIGAVALFANSLCQWSIGIAFFPLAEN